jgi:nitrite reductase (NO-forming)
MNRRPFVALSVVLTAALATGCASGTRATWTFAPEPTDVRTAVGPTAEPTDSQDPTAAPVTAAPATQAPSESGGTGVLGTLEIRTFDLGFEPATLSVDAPGRYQLALVNDGAILHDITFPDGTRIEAGAGETATAEIVVPEGGTEFLCSIPGHSQAGMTGKIEVTGSAPAPSEEAEPSAQPSHDGGGHGGPPPATSVEPDPEAPAPTWVDPTAPTRLVGEVHDIRLVMTERLMTVAEGYEQAVWTFGDTVPGPVIRAKVGDRIRIHLVNAPSNQLSHSIDFHSSMVAWNDEMRSIAPGEELVYEYEAKYAGVWMYHCGTNPTLHHIANGMYGMMIVEPAEGLEPVDQEFALVQSEWYLGPQGQPTDLTKASAGAPAPDFVVFNGVASQYMDAPIEVETGERVRVFVLDAGPSIDSSFHVVGTIFDRVVKEGIELTRGNAGNWGSQAVDLSAAQGAIVEFTFDEDGLYPFVTHAFNNVGRGAVGVFQAGDGDPTN